MMNNTRFQAESFSEYFDKCPVICVRGRMHPVSLFYCTEPQVDYLDSAIVAALQLHREEPLPGDILVFLTGQDEIEVSPFAYNSLLFVRMTYDNIMRGCNKAVKVGGARSSRTHSTVDRMSSICSFGA